MGIEGDHELIFGHDDEGIRSLDHGKGIADAVLQAGKSASFDQMGQDLCIRGRLEDAPLSFKLMLESVGIHQVPVMGEGKAAGLGVEEEGLYVFIPAASSRSIADMADGSRSFQLLDCPFMENLCDEAFSLQAAEAFPSDTTIPVPSCPLCCRLWSP